MGKRMLWGWQGPKAGRGVGSGRWGGWTGRRGDGEGWMATGTGGREGESGRGQRAGVDGEGSNRDGKGVTIWRGQCEEEMERGAMGKGGGGDGKLAMGRGERGKRWGWGRGNEGARGGEISQMDMMGCLGGHML